MIVTKENSGRERDRIDIGFLESKLRERYHERLSVCPLEEAVGLFSRYLDHTTCQAALANPDPAVQALGLSGLRELAEGGNPFAIEALKKRGELFDQASASPWLPGFPYPRQAEPGFQ